MTNVLLMLSYNRQCYFCKVKHFKDDPLYLKMMFSFLFLKQKRVVPYHTKSEDKQAAQSKSIKQLFFLFCCVPMKTFMMKQRRLQGVCIYQSRAGHISWRVIGQSDMCGSCVCAEFCFSQMGVKLCNRREKNGTHLLLSARRKTEEQPYVFYSNQYATVTSLNH